ncbi:2'-5' RNA ligase [Methanolinea mesophila]|uniref:RNA 2',3'-cyclic phosphodiesterase n=1 Tax=Methanolinea mesophila TaxID=547055 RepID=UPI001AEA45AB|nr:RNA 2',3'-cyclic phosphodiesterase [Methanolinea mesophila]MBP1929681.1 2'-5' RNA ligase [Methanolinea mesophila]
MVRLFVAVDLPVEIREKIRECQAELKTGKARVTLVKPDQIHLTLKFIGEVDEPTADKIREALKKIRFTSYGLEVGTIQANNPRRPRVIWCSIRDGGESEELHRRIEDVLLPLGVPREDRAFTSHATVARVKSYHPDLDEALQQLKGREFGSCRVERIILKKSTLTPSGPIYEDLMEVSC